MASKSLSIRVLGELEVVRDGRPIPLPASRKTRALLGYLVVTAREQPRERLCELLWNTPDDPRAALRWTLWKLRPALDDAGVPRLVADRARVVFEAHGGDVDVTNLRALLAGGTAEASTDALKAAAALFRGELLAGLDLPDCFEFQQWCTAEREALRVLRTGVLGTLVERLGDVPEEALGYARTRVTVDPLVEEAHVQVMELLARLGRPRDALRQYEICKRILESELRSRPGARLERVRASLSAPPAPAPASVAPGGAGRGAPVPVATPFVGRAEEVAVLDAFAGGASGTDLRELPQELLLITGDPGIGKTRLLEELGARVRGRGGLVLAGRAFEAERARPYGVWIDALRAAPLGEASAELRHELGALLPELDPGRAESGDRTRLHDAVARLVAWLAAERPVAILMDDLQWLDEHSVSLLHFLARGSRGVFAASARAGELGDNPSTVRLVRELDRERRLRRLPLGPLEAGAVAELVRPLCGASRLDVDQVVADSEGNPLFALEIARSSLPAEGTLPHSIERLIDERLLHVDEAARDIVPWMAVVGRSFRPELVARASELPPGTLLAGLAELERRAIVRVAGDDHYDFTHDLVRRAAYWRTPAPQRRLIHARVARALAAMDDRDGQIAGEIARHADLGGESELAAQACLRAAERCLQLFASGDAEALAELGWRHADRLERAARIRLQTRLLGVLVHPGVRLRRPGTLAPEIARLCAEAQEAGLGAECSLGLHHLARLYHWSLGDLPRARAALLHAAEVLATLPPEPNIGPLVESARCLASLEIGAGIARARQIFANIALIRGVTETADYQLGLGLLHRWDGDAAAARAALSDAVVRARDGKRHWVGFEAASTLAMLEIEVGQERRVLEVAPALRLAAQQLGEGGSEGPIIDALEALARLGLGDRQAAAAVDAAAGALVELDSQYHLAYLLDTAAWMDLRAGRLEAARKRASAGLRAATVADREVEIRRAHLLLANVAAAEGRAAEAAKIVEGLGLGDAGELPAHTRALLDGLRAQPQAARRTGAGEGTGEGEKHGALPG